MSATKSQRWEFLAKPINREQSKDTGLAMILILVFVGYLTGNPIFYKITLPVVLLVMILPGWFYPLAVLWFGLSHLLGSIMSYLLLTLIYFFIVSPIAMIRKIVKVDSLKLKQFKKDSKTVMNIRNHIFVPSDLEKPY